MAEHYGCTVRELLPDRLERMPKILEEKFAENHSEGRADFPGFAWEVIGSKATEAIQKSLDCDVFELLARAWCKARELQELTASGKYPPGQEATVFLGTHKLATQVHPVLVVTVFSIEGPRLRFTLELAAEFHSAALSILDGHITGIAAGDCSVSAQLKYGEVDLHKKLKSKSLKLFKPIKLTPPGLAIG